jgi:hypothetical protein
MLSHNVEEWSYRHFEAAIFGNDERQVVNPVSLGLATKSAMFVLRNRLGEGKKPSHLTDKSESMPFSLAQT